MSTSTLRSRVRDATNPEEIASELARYAGALGFERAVVLLIDGPKASHGYPNGVSAARLDASSLIEEQQEWTSPSSSPLMTSLDLSRAIAVPLRDVDGPIGIVVAGVASVAGESADEKKTSWPDAAAAALSAPLPDIAFALRHRMLRARITEQESLRAQQQAENDRLLRELRKRNEEMLDDLEQAREFQAQMLPRPPAIEGVAVHIVYRPHDAVSGDLHDVHFDASLDRLRVFLADTTGHGVRAGLATMLLKVEYERIKHSAKDPTEILTRLNARIVDAYRPNTLTMTAICYDLDVTTGALRYASAAHPSAVIVTRDAAMLVTTRELPSGGSFIGVVPEASLHEGSAALRVGEAIYVYTDGISEAAGPSNDLFGEARICASLIATHTDALGGGTGTSTTKDGARALVKSAEAFARPRGFNDDVAIVGVTRVARSIS